MPTLNVRPIACSRSRTPTLFLRLHVFEGNASLPISLLSCPPPSVALPVHTRSRMPTPPHADFPSTVGVAIPHRPRHPSTIAICAPHMAIPNRITHRAFHCPPPLPHTQACLPTRFLYIWRVHHGLYAHPVPEFQTPSRVPVPPYGLQAALHTVSVDPPSCVACLPLQYIV